MTVNVCHKMKKLMMAMAGAVLASGAFGESAELPEGYFQVEYIESSGGAYIDAEYHPTLNTRIVADFNPLGTQDWGSFFGVTENDESIDGILMRYYGSGDILNGWFCNENYHEAQIAGVANKRIQVELKAGGMTVDGSSATITTTGTPYDGSIYLFSVNYNGEPYRSHAMRLYAFTIYDTVGDGNERKVRDFVPCVRKSDQAVGFYDLAADDPGKAFYTNAGSGMFGVPDGTFCTVTVGTLANMTAAYTFGDGSVTNAVGGESFGVLKGQTGVKVIFTANEGYVLGGNAVVDVEIGDQGEACIADAVPTATHLPAVVTVTAAKQRWPWNGKVDVGYALSNTAAGEYYRLITAVTVDGTTKAVTNEVGAVTSGTVTVDCAALFGTGVLAPASVTMAVRTYSAPEITTKWQLAGPFLILDLGGENGKEDFTSATYETTADLPTGAWNLDTGWANAYKTRYLVMRKVKAGKAYPCKPDSTGAITTTMTPVKDYWIGVHQVTQEQYARVMSMSLQKSDQAKPANYNWNTIRGGAGVLEAPEGFMSALSGKTGLAGFDLPTEAQWEIAARAGSKAEYGSYVDVNGKVQTATADNLTNIAWHDDNNSPLGTKEVGQLRPNLWGLYDTAGNVWEWCRDGYVSTFNRQDVETPAEGHSSVTGSGYQVLRGGCYSSDTGDCRPSLRFNYIEYSGKLFAGFRLSRICEPDAQDK